MQVYATLLCAAAVLLRSIYAQTPMNLTFSPWQVMGPVDTNGTGYAILTYVGGQLDYEFHLFNVRGLQSVELHVGMQTEHGDVAAVFYKAPFANVSQVSNGRVAAGTLTSYDLLGPFLLPLGEHLEVSMVYDGYVNEGLATVVVHTLVNPGGELGAYTSSMISSAPMGASMNAPMKAAMPMP
ncbi:TPA: hypothetical protein ACH3X1_016183 [Trebouxia sp. C0004]